MMRRSMHVDRRTVCVGLGGLRSYTTSGVVPHPAAQANTYTGLADIASHSSQLRPTPAGRLRNLVVNQSTSELWGNSTTAHPLAATPEHATELWLKMGLDPLFHGSPTDGAVEPDMLGGDLTSSDANVVRDSVALWSKHFQARFLQRLRLARESGASQLGQVGERHAAEDEVDSAKTTWAQDREFLRACMAVRETLPEKPATLEQLELALQRAAPEAFSALVEAGFPSSSPHPYAPVPTSARWHLADSALVEWAIDFQTARTEALNGTLSALRSAVESAEWVTIANAIATKLEAVAAILAARRVRQISEGLRPAWEECDDAKKAELSLIAAQRQAKGLMQGECDVEEPFDSTEAWIEEHEKITALLQEPVVEGNTALTTHSIWMATARLEAVEFRHQWADAGGNYRQLHAACIRRARDENGEEAVDAADSAFWRGSSFSAGSCDVVPDAAALPAAWCKTNWWRFCGAHVATRHGPHGALQLGTNYAPLAATAARVALHYGLRPLSGSIDYSTPFKHRQSLLKILTTAAVAEERACALQSAETQRALARVGDSIATLRNVAAWPYGVQRRAANAAVRARLQQRVFPVTDVAVPPVSDEATIAARAEIGVEDNAAWIIGSSRNVTYEWEPATQMVMPTTADPIAAALERKKALSSVAIQVSLWRKTDAPATVASAEYASALEAAKAAVAGNPALKSVADQLSWSFARTTRSASAAEVFPESPSLEAPQGFEYAGMLHDAHPGSPDGVLNVNLRHLADGFVKGESLSVTPGVYRLRLRCFQKSENPECKPTLCSEAFTAPFDVVDALPAAFAAHGADAGLLPAKKFGSFFETLRRAGLAVNTALEFEAGQNLAATGDAIASEITRLIAEGTFADVGTRSGITAAQLDIEPRVLSAWRLANPGATLEEWHGARRHVLHNAISRERDWWLYSDELDAPSTDTGSQEPAAAMEAFGRDFASVLEAEAASGDASAEGIPRSQPLASAAYHGTGTVASLKFGEGCRDLSVDEVLRHAVTAVDAAHVRINTMTGSRTAEMEKLRILGVATYRNTTDFGGKYATTRVAAFNAAQAGVQTHRHVTANPPRVASASDAEPSVQSEAPPAADPPAQTVGVTEDGAAATAVVNEEPTTGHAAAEETTEEATPAKETETSTNTGEDRKE